METKKTRGPGKKPSLVHISVRISKEADEFYASAPNKSEYIRRVLQEHYEANVVQAITML